MFRKLSILLLMLMPFSSHLQAGVWDQISSFFGGGTGHEQPTIRVLLVHDVPGTNLEVRGKYSLYDPNENARLSSRFVGKSKYLEAMRSGLRWGETFPGLYQLEIQPDEANTTVIIEDQSFTSPIYIYDIGGTLSITTQLTIEDYVHAILQNQALNTLHPETLAALSIVARTNAYHQALNPKTNFWAVDAQKVGYRGNAPQLGANSLVNDAVRQTRNMVMSRTGVYEGTATPFLAEFGTINPGHSSKDVVLSRITIEEANEMARNGEHAAQILGKAFPGVNIMLGQ